MRLAEKCSATSAGTWLFIAQVSSSDPVEPNFAPRHEDDVARARQRRHLVTIEQIGCNRLDAVALEVVLEPRLGKPGHAEHPAVGGGTHRHPGDRRPHLAADADHHDVAVDLFEICNEGRCRAWT